MTEMTNDARHQSRAETRLAARILLVLVVVLAVVVALVWTLGVQIIGPLGLVLTLVVFAILLAFTAGR